MPPKAESLEQLLLLALGGVLWWLGGFMKDRIKGFTERRRTEVDKQARTDRKLHEAKEQVWALRSAMLRSGHWTLEDLEQFDRRGTDRTEDE